jgi:hypothetical protein
MSFLLNLQFGAVLECPFHDIRVRGSALHRLTLAQGGPERAEALDFDQVPDGAEWSFDDG